MNTQESWKYGFLLRCAEEGLDQPRIDARVRKIAASLGDVVQNAALLGLITPPILGYGAGYVGGNAVGGTINTPADVKQLQNQEVADVYDSFADDLEKRNRKDLVDVEDEA